MTAVPPVTEAARREASQKPGGWVYAIDPAFDPAGKVPPYAIIGAWPVTDEGALAEPFRHNEKYRPSAKALGWPTPSNGLEAALQDLATGRLDDETFLRVFADATVHVFGSADQRGEELFVGRPEGAEAAVSAFTDLGLLTATGHPYSAALHGLELAAAVPDDAVILLNPGSIPVGRVDPRRLLALS
jgi:hypothetical protein